MFKKDNTDIPDSLVVSIIAAALLVWFVFEMDKNEKKDQAINNSRKKKLNDDLKGSNLSDEIKRQVLSLTQRYKDIKPITAFEITKILSFVQIGDLDKAINSIIEINTNRLKEVYHKDISFQNQNKLISINKEQHNNLFEYSLKTGLLSTKDYHVLKLLNSYRNNKFMLSFPNSEKDLFSSVFVSSLEVILKIDRISKQQLFSIGYGDRKIDNFMSILKKYSIQYLVDIRSTPFSKYNPDYNRNELDKFLHDQGIRYIFLGDFLGGRPGDQSCYIDGRVDYQEVSKRSFFIEGLNRIKSILSQNNRIVLMCSEIKPQDCHRTKLIGRELSSINADILHIDENTELKKQDEVMLLVTKGANDINLFGEDHLTMSRKKYI